MSWPLAGGGNALTSITTGGSSVAANAAANTKGNWLQLSGGLAFDCDQLVLELDQRTVSQNRDVLCDIGVGGAGSEVSLIDNLLFSLSPNDFKVAVYQLPIHIPKGTRVAARIQASTGSTEIEIWGRCFAATLKENQGFPWCQTIGANTADSGGTTIDPGGVISTAGAWTQLVASCDRHVKAMTLAMGGQLNAARIATVCDFDIGIGGAGSEITLFTVRIRTSATPSSVTPATYGLVPVSIPPGTRIAARATNYSTTDATDRIFDLVGYLFG